MTLTAIIFAGILTYFTRMTMIALISRDMLGDKIKAVLRVKEGEMKKRMGRDAKFIGANRKGMNVSDSLFRRKKFASSEDEERPCSSAQKTQKCLKTQCKTCNDS